MGAIGRQRVEEELSWDHTKKNLLLAYDRLFPSSFETSVPYAENVVDEKLEIYQ